MIRTVKLPLCVAVVIAPCLFIGTAALADEQYTPTQVVTVPGGLTSFDISFVDPDVGKYALADRTNKAVDIVDTSTKAIVQRTASPPFVGVIASPANAAGLYVVFIVDHREIWAADGPLLGGCVPSPTGLRCS